MNRSYRLLMIVLVLFVSAGFLFARSIERETFVEPVDNAKEAEITFEMGLCEMDLSPGKADELIHVEAMYDADHFKPDFRVKRDTDKVYVYLNPRGDDKSDMDNIDSDDHYYDVKLSPEIPMNLNFEIGLGEHDMDLSGLKIERIHIESGLAETRLKLDKANPITAKSIDVETGLGEFYGEGLGYLRFERFDLECGLGEASVDFTGFEGDGEVNLSVGLGDLEIILPKG
ncbi:hypothetical protein GF324_13345, partial [bacterium]|nr:hypothetical protein [bacterium]